jgi:hypothetical protein
MYIKDLCRVFAEAHCFGLTRKEVIRSSLLTVKYVGGAGVYTRLRLLVHEEHQFLFAKEASVARRCSLNLIMAVNRVGGEATSLHCSSRTRHSCLLHTPFFC